MTMLELIGIPLGLFALSAGALNQVAAYTPHSRYSAPVQTITFWLLIASMLLFLVLSFLDFRGRS